MANLKSRNKHKASVKEFYKEETNWGMKNISSSKNKKIKDLY